MWPQGLCMYHMCTWNAHHNVLAPLAEDLSSCPPSAAGLASEHTTHGGAPRSEGPRAGLTATRSHLKSLRTFGSSDPASPCGAGPCTCCRPVSSSGPSLSPCVRPGLLAGIPEASPPLLVPRAGGSSKANASGPPPKLCSGREENTSCSGRSLCPSPVHAPTFRRPPERPGHRASGGPRRGPQAGPFSWHLSSCVPWLLGWGPALWPALTVRGEWPSGQAVFWEQAVPWPASPEASPRSALGPRALPGGPWTLRSLTIQR